MPRLTMWRALRRDDRGSALVSVIGIVLVTIVIATTIAATTISSLERTDDTRDISAAEFAAEAGVAVAEAAIASKTCTTNPVFETTNANPPFYRAVVQHRVGGSFTKGCPAAGEDIRIVSTGYDTEADFSAKSGTFRSVEALYGQVPQPFAPSGPAVFAYGDIAFDNHSTIVASPGRETVLMSYSGDVACSNSSNGAASVIVRDGTFTADNSCAIGGDVWVTGADPAGAVSFTNSVDVGGRVVARSLTIANNHSGTLGALYADTYSMSADKLAEHGPVGTRSAAGPRPPVPGWVDFDFVASDWAGFEIVKSSGACNSASIMEAMASRAGTKVVIDAMHCNWLNLDNGFDLSISADLAIVARSFTLKQADFRGTGKEQLWLITPDGVRDGHPTCESWTAEGKKGGTVVDDVLDVGTNSSFTGLSVMFYTPCVLNFAQAITIKGQIFAADVGVKNQLTFTFSPSGLPNQNLDTGAADTPPTTHAISSYVNTTTTAESIIGGAG